jgi:hypothetical protein
LTYHHTEEDIMARDYAKMIAGLLANAEDEGNSDEARQSYRNKAEAMMRQYRIDQEDALATDPGSAAPIVKRVVLVPTYNQFRNAYFPTIVRTLADHTECLVYIHWVNGEGNVADVVGYEGDVRYFEYLWTAAHLMFATRVDPIWADDRTEAENIFLLRNAGHERREIADRAWGPGAGTVAANRSKIQRIYLAEAKRRGEDALATGLGFNTRMYRESYARQFITTLHSRLWRARQAANAAGGVVTLAGRAERVREALWAAFPDLRPSTDAVAATDYLPPNHDCDRCRRAKSGFCREHNWLKPREVTKADQERWDRQQHSASARAGRASGRTAAEGVHIQRGTAETGKMDASETRAIG